MPIRSPSEGLPPEDAGWSTSERFKNMPVLADAADTGVCLVKLYRNWARTSAFEPMPAFMVAIA